MVTMQQPPILRGTDTEKIARIHSYLYQIVRDLNSALNNLTEDNFAAESNASQILRNGGTEAQRKEQSENLSALKSLIIKTADTVHAEMDVIETELSSVYTAIGDPGTFDERIDAKITASATGLEQQFKTTTNIISQTLTEIDTRGFIRQGIIGYNKDATPIIGIAIGENVEVNESGEIVTEKNNLAIWTSDRLSFYVLGAEVAHFSNRALNVGDVIVSGKLALSNNKWEITHTNGFTIKWIGGDGA